MNALRNLNHRIPGHPIAKAAVPVVVVALVAAIIWQPGTPAVAPGSSPTPSAAAVATGSPPPDETEPWADLELPEVAVLAELNPLVADAAGVATTSAFTLRSLGSESALELAEHVEAQPAIEFRVRAGATPDEAILEPATALSAGTTYRFRLTAADGSLGGSWAFQTQHPLQVVGTLPGNLSTDVPVRTGIEVTFDQDGTTGLAEHFTIEPAVTGRFEQHGRTWAFVPDSALAPATAYRVTIGSGVAIAGSDQVLEAEVSFRFETAAPETTEPWVRFAASLSALRPGQRPEMVIYTAGDDDGETVVTELPIEVYRLPDLPATIAAAERLTGPDRWLHVSPTRLVSTDGLTRVASVDAPVIVSVEGTTLLRVPVALDAGAYLIVVPRQAGDAQHLVQVGNLAAYAQTSEAGAIAWVNDLAIVGPVAGAIVALPDGRRLATADAQGLARFATPSELVPSEPIETDDEWLAPNPNVISVTAPDGRWIVVALGAQGAWLDGEVDNSAPSDDPRDRYWLTFSTDRERYRQTDVVRAWGLIRERSDRSVPQDVEVRLRPYDGDSETAVAKVAVTPTNRGVFAVELPIRDLPSGGYVLVLYADGRPVDQAWIEVGEIRKPAYRLEVETDRFAYFDGQRVRITIQGSFFDGTPLAGLDLRVTSTGLATQVTTDENGFASVTTDADFGGDRPDTWSSRSVKVRPVRPEEADITGSARFLVFPSRAWLSGTASLEGTTLVAEGTAIRVDLASMAEAGVSASWPAEPTGPALAGATVSARVVRNESIRKQVGTEYDYVEKQVVPVYEYDVVKHTIGTFQTTTAADGSYRLAISVPSAKDEYEIRIWTQDGAGRRIETTRYAWPKVRERGGGGALHLVGNGVCGGYGSLVVPVGESAVLTFHNRDGSVATEGRFLFLVATSSRLDAVLTPGSTFERRLANDILPGFLVRGIQFTGEGYGLADASVRVDPADMRIRVTLDPDQARYRPGEQATVGITTTTPDGLPVAADVVLRGIDEKLFAIGAASDTNPVAELYWPTGSGFLQSAASHRFDRFEGGGCGGVGGGAARTDFGDVVTFQLVRTGADGRGVASFKLLDDLTSWRLMATAVTGNLRAGRATVQLPVSLPFFVEPTLAPVYLVGEEPILRLRAYGAGLERGDPVSFTVSAPSLGLAETVVEGVAFEAVRVPLPALPAGDHAITISGQGPASRLSDSLVRTIHVIPTRLTGLEVHYDPLTPGYQVRGGPGLTDYLVLDAGRGSLVPLLQELASSTSARFDRSLAADEARRLLVSEFGFDAARLPSTGFEVGRYQRGMIGLLPYSSGDLELTALAALVAPDRIDNLSLRGELALIASDAVTTRERRIQALTALAALDQEVLTDLRALGDEELTIRESLWLALGLLASGDENGARTIERRLLDEHGQRLGGWVRLAVGDSLETTIEAARLLLILSSRLGEPFAADVARYLADHPSRTRAVALEQLAYVMAGLERLPRAAGRAAWTLDGERHEVTVERGASLHLVLTAEQRATFHLEPLEGQLVVVTSWSGENASLPTGAEATIVRTIEPAGGAPDDGLVRVTITVSFDAIAPGGCWQITDLVPSGLAPLPQDDRWREDSSIVTPYEIDAQRVSWCAVARSPDRTFGYVARVVSPGTYRWEPAVIQSASAPELGAATEGISFNIR